MVRVTGVAVCLALFAVTVGAGEVSDLKKEVEKLRKEINNRGSTSAIGSADAMVGNKYGPNNQVTTKAGKLNITGLIQVWYQSVQNDNKGLFVPAGSNSLDPSDLDGGGTGLPGLTIPETNETHDNDTFRIRRTELKFTIDIHENVLGVVMIDPTRESNLSFYPMPTFPEHNGRFQNPVANPVFGPRIAPQLLQDAYINFHGIVPHHDFTIGQFTAPGGEEAYRGSGYLDFVERSMVTGIQKIRDTGVVIHGDWLDGKVQYWAGVLNGPDGTILSDPEIFEGGNRSDDNDEKDLCFRIAVRPIYDKEKWYGRLELGYHRTDGWRGESAGPDIDTPINGLNASTHSVNRTGAWGWYRPGGPVRGWWIRGEWGSQHGNFSVFRAPTNSLAIGGSGAVLQLNPKPVTAQGWYVGTGYKLSESRWADSCPGWLKPWEFAFRYEVYENIATEDLNNPDRNTDLFKTQAWTAGINYYIKGYDARIQANYIVVDEPSDGNLARGIREIRNNAFVVAFQVMF